MEKIKSKADDLSTPSNLDLYKNPNPNAKLSLYEAAPGNLNTLVKRKLRSSIGKILEKEHGRDFADNNWEGFFQFIIQAHLAIHDPKVYGKMLQESQIEKIKNDFPCELQFVSGIQKMIDDDATMEHIISANEL